MVPPFDHPWIIAGQGTVGLEILDDCPEVARILVPVGGGGLVAGVAAAVKQRRPGVNLVGVEPTGAAKITASLAAGRPVALDRVASLADGLLPVRPGDLTFHHVRRFVDEMVTVDDDPIAAAVLWLFRRAKLVVETSGAATPGRPDERVRPRGGRRRHRRRPEWRQPRPGDAGRARRPARGTGRARGFGIRPVAGRTPVRLPHAGGV